MGQKYEKVAPFEKEIQFIALPSVQQLRNYTGDHVGREGNKAEGTLCRYEHAQRQIYNAQRRCAVIAAEIMRPQDLRGAKMDYRMVCEEAKRKYQDAALAVFSETCTKGL